MLASLAARVARHAFANPHDRAFARTRRYRNFMAV